jgi:hypothetical protein
MNNNTQRLQALLDSMKDAGIVSDERKAEIQALVDSYAIKEELEPGFVAPTIPEFTTPRIPTPREEKIYTFASKVLDKTFNAYGVVKDKAVPKTVEASKTAVVVSRSWLGNMLKKVGEKIEPKKS